MFVCITVGCGYDSEGNICYGATIFFASTNYLLFFNADATNNRPKANNIYTIPNVKISDMTSIYVN